MQTAHLDFVGLTLGTWTLVVLDWHPPDDCFPPTLAARSELQLSTIAPFGKTSGGTLGNALDAEAMTKPPCPKD